MKGIQYKQHGGYDRLLFTELPDPLCASNDVLVEVKAAAVNVGDNTLRLGQFPKSKLPLVPGFEGMGTILDPGDSDFEAGERVMFTGFMGVTRDGTWCERIAVSKNDCVKVPDTLSDTEAAGFPVAYLTAYLGLKAGGFTSGLQVLIPAVGGAVGNAGIQLAAALGASLIVTTAGSSAKAERARKDGYENVIDLSRESLRERVRELTYNRGVDLVLDGIGGELTKEALLVSAKNGSHVLYGAVGGMISQFNPFDLIMTGSRLIGFAALIAQPPEDIAKAYDVIVKLAAQGKVKPVVSQIFSLKEAARAQRFLIEERPFGKVLLCP